MVRGWCRRSVAALAAGVALVSAPFCSAQQLDISAMKSSELLATMKPQSVEAGAGVFYGRLDGHGVFFISDGVPAQPAFIVVSNREKDRLSEVDLRWMAGRFVGLYKLSGYGVLFADDSSAFFLVRTSGQNSKLPRRQQAMQGLTHRKGLAPAIAWLNATCGNCPQRLEGSRLIWRKDVKAGSNVRPLEVALDLLRGAPCCVELSLPGVGTSKLEELLSDHLRLELEPVPNARASSLRRRIGAKPLRLMEGSLPQGRRRQQVELCLVRAADEEGLFRLGEPDALHKRIKEAAQEPTLPDMPDMPWVDELAAGQKPEQTETNQPAEPAPLAEAAAPPPLTPEEARKAYQERLKSL